MSNIKFNLFNLSSHDEASSSNSFKEFIHVLNRTIEPVNPILNGNLKLKNPMVYFIPWNRKGSLLKRMLVNIQWDIFIYTNELLNSWVDCEKS